jgi:hypothetical protein
VLALTASPHHRQTCIAAANRMANSIRFIFTKEYHLIRFRDRLDLIPMTHEEAAVREHEVRCANAFLITFVPARA